MKSNSIFISVCVWIASAGSLHASDSVTPPIVTALKPVPADEIQLRRALLVGAWYGDQPTKTGGRKQWIMRRASDGTFQVTFRVSDPVDGTTEQSEFGDWGLNSKFLVTVTRGYLLPDGKKIAARSADSYFWDVYEILGLTERECSYRSVETENSYLIKKVSPDFGFPKEPNQAVEPTAPSGRGSP